MTDCVSIGKESERERQETLCWSALRLMNSSPTTVKQLAMNNDQLIACHNSISSDADKEEKLCASEKDVRFVHIVDNIQSGIFQHL